MRESFNARPQMLNIATNEKLVRSTGISFAVVVTVMHGLNIARMTNVVLSQAWSVIADRQPHIIERSDVSLP